MWDIAINSSCTLSPRIYVSGNLYFFLIFYLFIFASCYCHEFFNACFGGFVSHLFVIEILDEKVQRLFYLFHTRLILQCYVFRSVWHCYVDRLTSQPRAGQVLAIGMLIQWPSLVYFKRPHSHIQPTATVQWTDASGRPEPDTYRIQMFTLTSHLPQSMSQSIRILMHQTEVCVYTCDISVYRRWQMIHQFHTK